MGCYALAGSRHASCLLRVGATFLRLPCLGRSTLFGVDTQLPLHKFTYSFKRGI